MVMGVSKTLRGEAGSIEGAPSPQIEAKLISSQHQELAALCLGVLLAPAFLLYVSFMEGVKTLIVLGFVLIFAGLVRVGMTLAYRSFGEGAGSTALSFWRPATILSVWFFSASLGAFAYIAITQTNDFRFHLVSIAIVGAYAAGTVGRNAAIQVGITGQLATTVLCVAIALFQRDDYIYKLLSLLVVLYLMSLSAISRSVYDLIVSVLKATEEKAHLLDEITEKSDRLDTALSNMPQGLAMFDEDWRIVVSNSQFQRILGFSCAESESWTVKEMLASVWRNGVVSASVLDRLSLAFLDAVCSPSEKEIEFSTLDNRVLEMSFQPKARRGFVVIVTDVTEKKAAESRIIHLAHHDRLTDLPNRSFFEEKFAQRLIAAAAVHEDVAVMALDLDHFKIVNDTLGHLVGDQLLVAVADRIKRLVPSSDFISRFGGDEFMLIHNLTGKGRDAAEFANHLIKSISAPYVIENHEIVVGLTIGVTYFPRDGIDPNELLRNADLALYSAKRDRRGTCRFFRQEMDREAQERWQLEIDLRTAIEKSQFQLYYQPIVDLSTKQICGCEALIRWEHSKKGWIPPAKFIPIAEETGAIVEIGRWVLFKACADAMLWPNQASVSVNLSAIQFRRLDIVATVKQALEVSGLDPRRLDLEITESILLEDSDGVREALMALRQLGVSISLDDFGTGYSSFSYLVAYPIDKVKLDRSFISAITTSREKRAVVRAASMLAEELGLVLVAEGVETAEELAVVAAQSIHRVQGFYFSRPVPIDAIPWEHSLAHLTAKLRRIA